jgi:hypothetical protein
MWLWWWTLDGPRIYGPGMNSLLARPLAALLADASGGPRKRKAEQEYEEECAR